MDMDIYKKTSYELVVILFADSSPNNFLNSVRWDTLLTSALKKLKQEDLRTASAWAIY